jgi:hypothetical protein
MPKPPPNQGSGRPGTLPTPPPPRSQAPAESILLEPGRPIKPDPPVVPPIPDTSPLGRPGENGLPPAPPPPSMGEVPPPKVIDPRDKAPKFVPPKTRKPAPLIV